jgi:DNA-binding response OmpR family regulator
VSAQRDDTNRKKRILVIEDDGGISHLLVSRLRRSGFDVSAAKDGQEGLNVVRCTQPDLVILDLMLPGLPGEEIMKAIREDESAALSRTPVIMLTGKATDVDQIIGKVAGANAYLTKPFNANELMNKVTQFVSQL